MPRHPRLFIPGAVYHVTSRVARGEVVFDDAFEANQFIRTLGDVRDIDGFTVLAWCLLGNHYHLVLRTERIDLWRSMARLQGRVARSFNHRHGFRGRLWQSRYHARVVDTDEYFRQVVAYVHLNPVAAGLVVDPGDYPLSGHQEILGRCPARVVDLHAVLRGFGDGAGTGAVESYWRWIRAVAEARWVREGVAALPWWKEARHRDEIASAEQHPEARTFDGRDPDELRVSLTFPDFVHRFEVATGYDLAELASRSRDPGCCRRRIEFTVLAVERYSLRMCDIASRLSKDRTSASRWLNRGLRLARDDAAFRARLGELDRAISEPGETISH